MMATLRVGRATRITGLFALAVLVFLLCVFAPYPAHWLGTIAIAGAASFAWVFVLFYRNRAWKTYREGRNLMETTVVFALILTYLALVNLFATSNAPTRGPEWEYPRLVIALLMLRLFVARALLLVPEHLHHDEPVLARSSSDDL